MIKFIDKLITGINKTVYFFKIVAALQKALQTFADEMKGAEAAKEK